MQLTGKNDNLKKKGQTTMNHYGILTNYEERMEANLEQYSRPEESRGLPSVPGLPHLGQANVPVLLLHR